MPLPPPHPEALSQARAPPGFYPVNHTDCLVSPLHHCFDGPTGELAHAFFPPHGGIHFDDSEYWVLGPTRYSWKKGDAVLASHGAPPPRWEQRGSLRGRVGDFGSSWRGGEAGWRPQAWVPGVLKPPHPHTAGAGAGAAFLGASSPPSRPGTFLSSVAAAGRLPALQQLCRPRGARRWGGGGCWAGYRALTGRACRRVAHRPGARGGP